MQIYSRRGFSLVEIMIVVAIIAIFLAISVPNYFKSGKTSAKNVCINNLKQIDSAIDRWAIDNDIPEGTVPSTSQEDEIYNYFHGDKPVCPSGGEYSIHATGSKPQVTCTRADIGHVLPE